MALRTRYDRIKLVRNDTGPQLRITIIRIETNQPVNLTGATVNMHFRSEDTEKTVFSLPLTVLDNRAEQGEAVVVWRPGDLDQIPGDYTAEFEVIFPSGLIETAFETLDFRIRDEFG